MTDNNDTQLANVEMIRNSPLGNELSDSQCQALSEKVTVMGLKEGQILIDEGKKDNNLYVIISGHLEVLINSTGGDLVTLHLLREGDMAGELGFLDGRPHSASLRAVGNCTAIVLTRDDFESFIDQDPNLMYKVMRSIIRTVHSILCDMNKSHVEMNNYIYKQHGRY
jgi:CRP/FNR family transcriptional regulator, cyclic AMP receptor protein